MKNKYSNNSIKSTITPQLSILNHYIILSVNYLAFIGITLIVYGFVVLYTKQAYPLLDKFADPLSTYSTLLGLLITALSVYSNKAPKTPDSFSKKISAPIVIAVVIITAGILIFTKSTIPPHMLNGFGLLGIAGGLFRTI